MDREGERFETSAAQKEQKAAAAEAQGQRSEAEAEQAVLHPAPHKGTCDALYFSADRSRLLTAGADGRLACLETREKETSMSRSWAQKITHSLRVTAAAVSSYARMLAVAEETASGFQAWVHLLDAKGRTVQGQKPRIAGRFTLDIRHLSWHPSLPYLCIATDDGKVDIWHETYGRKQLLKGGGPVASGGVRCACLDDKAEKIAAAFASGDLAVVDVETSKEQFRSKLWPKSVGGSERLSMSWAPNGLSATDWRSQLFLSAPCLCRMPGSYLALPGEQLLACIPARAYAVRLLLHAASFFEVCPAHVERLQGGAAGRCGVSTGHGGHGPAPFHTTWRSGGHRFSTTIASWSAAHPCPARGGGSVAAVFRSPSGHVLVSASAEALSATFRQVSLGLKP